jgi:hypothetical protein
LLLVICREENTVVSSVVDNQGGLQVVYRQTIVHIEQRELRNVYVVGHNRWDVLCDRRQKRVVHFLLVLVLLLMLLLVYETRKVVLVLLLLLVRY